MEKNLIITITIIIIKDNYIYSANVGNISAFIFLKKKQYCINYEIIEITTDHSLTENPYNFSLNNNNNNKLNSSKEFNFLDLGKNSSFNLKPIKISNENFDKFKEVNRIYENGGELRTIAEEKKFRIFSKGNYFHALFSSRSIGDELGCNIGIISDPSISCFQINKNFEIRNDKKLNLCLISNFY